MVLTVPDGLAARLRALAVTRGEPVDDVAIGLLEASTATATGSAGPGDDPLEAFIGCGASGDSRPRTIHSLRDELSAAQLDQNA